MKRSQEVDQYNFKKRKEGERESIENKSMLFGDNISDISLWTQSQSVKRLNSRSCTLVPASHRDREHIPPQPEDRPPTGPKLVGTNIEVREHSFVDGVTQPVPVASTSTVCAENSLDISHIIGQKLSDEDKYKYLTHSLEPPSNYEFPEQTENGQKRKFQSAWLKKYPWLVYSQQKNGAYCLPCVLFSGPESSVKRSVALRPLVTHPFNKFEKALAKFKNHSNANYHQRAVLKSTDFKNSYENSKKAVNTLIATKKLNREQLTPIIKTIILCGREKLPLRGHRDDGICSITQCNDSDEIGLQTFRALLEFRIDAGDSSLQKHLETAPKNAIYVSKTTQNLLIDCCHSVIMKKVLDKAKEAKYYAILADETIDASGTEQLSIFIKYLDIQRSTIHEEFVCLLPATYLTGAAVSDQIIEELNRVGLKIENLRGQGYDGGANLSGKLSDVHSAINQLQPLAPYMHCAAHKLNLAMVKACSMARIRNMMGIVNSVTNYLRESEKRLERAILANHPEAKRVKLQSLSDTSWVEGHDVLLQFKTHFEAIVQFLKEIDRIFPSLESARFLASIQRFNFILLLTITATVFEVTDSLSRQLQAVPLDLNLCYEMVENVVRTLEGYKDTKYEEIFLKAYRIVKRLEIAEQAPRTAQRSTHRSKITVAPYAKEYYRTKVFLPFIDFVLEQLASRFSKEKHSSILNLFKLLPNDIVKTENLNSIVEAARKYRNDLPELPTLSGEISNWKDHWSKEDHLPNTVAEAHQKTKAKFPNIKILLQILATLPITTCNAEHSFFSLKRIKCYLRTTMTEDNSAGLAAMYIHRNISGSLQVNEVIEELMKSNPRKLVIR